MRGPMAVVVVSAVHDSDHLCPGLVRLDSPRLSFVLSRLFGEVWRPRGPKTIAALVWFPRHGFGDMTGTIVGTPPCLGSSELWRFAGVWMM